MTIENSADSVSRDSYTTAEEHWFAVNEAGKIVGIVADVPVVWTDDGYDASVTGIYMFTAETPGYEYPGAGVFALVDVDDCRSAMATEISFLPPEGVTVSQFAVSVSRNGISAAIYADGRPTGEPVTLGDGERLSISFNWTVDEHYAAGDTIIIPVMCADSIPSFNTQSDVVFADGKTAGSGSFKFLPQPGGREALVYIIEPGENIQGLKPASGSVNSWARLGVDARSEEIIFTGGVPDEYASSPPTAVVTIFGETEISGIGAPENAVFSFTLTQVTDASASQQVPEGIVKTAAVAAGEAEITDIDDLTEGTYYFLVQQTSGGGAYWNTDNAARLVEVSVSGAPLKAAATYLSGSPTFKNTYTAPQSFILPEYLSGDGAVIFTVAGVALLGFGMLVLLLTKKHG
jgi:hypothetical protein